MVQEKWFQNEDETFVKNEVFINNGSNWACDFFVCL